MRRRPENIYLQLFVTITTVVFVCTVQVNSLEYPARYQPELENVTLESFTSNPRLFNLEVKCLLYDGPCDIVGRFLKPRIAKGLLGECVLCTPRQQVTLNKLLLYIQEERPDLYRLAIAKYLEHSGIELPPDELEKLRQLEKLEDGAKTGAPQ